MSVKHLTVPRDRLESQANFRDWNIPRDLRPVTRGPKGGNPEAYGLGTANAESQGNVNGFCGIGGSGSARLFDTW